MSTGSVINFGPLAAQDDPDLLTYFIESAQLRNLVGQNSVGAARFLVISRPGAGKSATFEWLASDTSHVSAIMVRGANHRILPADRSLNIDDYRTLAFGELATAIILESRRKFDLSGVAKSQAASFTRRKAVQNVTNFFTERFEGLNILGSGFKLSEPERRNYLDRMRDREFQVELESVLKEIAGQVRPVVAVDDPEYMSAEGIDPLSVDNAVRLGASLSALSRLDALGLRIAVFLREQVYRSVVENYSDASHFADRTNGLGWTEEELLRLLDLRIRRRLHTTWPKIFSLTKRQVADKVFPYLVNGPRDLLTICNVAAAGGTPISDSALEKAIQESQRGRWLEVRKQFQSVLPSFDSFAAACLQWIVKTLGSSNIEPQACANAISDALSTPSSDVFKLRSVPWIDALPFSSGRRPVELLFAAGCLGYTQGPEVIYPWAGRSTERFALADHYFVSRAFPLVLPTGNQ